MAQRSPKGGPGGISGTPRMDCGTSLSLAKTFKKSCAARVSNLRFLVISTQSVSLSRTSRIAIELRQGRLSHGDSFASRVDASQPVAVAKATPHTGRPAIVPGASPSSPSASGINAYTAPTPRPSGTTTRNASPLLSASSEIDPTHRVRNEALCLSILQPH
jgi:hypothetical protein